MSQTILEDIKERCEFQWNRMTDFDRMVTEKTIKEVLSGNEFFYVSGNAFDEESYSIGAVSQKFFDKHNKAWGTKNQYKMTKTTADRVGVLYDKEKFLENKKQELMLQSRANVYLGVMCRLEKLERHAKALAEIRKAETQKNPVKNSKQRSQFLKCAFCHSEYMILPDGKRNNYDNTIWNTTLAEKYPHIQKCIDIYNNTLNQ